MIGSATVSRVGEISASPPASDRVARLVVAARGGDQAAFTALYGRFHRVVHAVVLTRCRRGEDADLVQDVFATAFEKLPDLLEPAAFPGWLLTIARRRAIEGLRRPLRVAPLDEAHEPGVSPPPRAEALEALEAIRALPEAYAETLVMRLVEGLSGPEIAERTGLTEGSVRVNLHRGMALLRERLSSEPSMKSEPRRREP